jgi:hypothetical protein
LHISKPINTIQSSSHTNFIFEAFMSYSAYFLMSTNVCVYGSRRQAEQTDRSKSRNLPTSPTKNSHKLKRILLDSDDSITEVFEHSCSSTAQSSVWKKLKFFSCLLLSDGLRKSLACFTPRFQKGQQYRIYHTIHLLNF